MTAITPPHTPLLRFHRHTGCEGVVSGEGLLHNPALFETVDQPDQEQDSRGRLLQVWWRGGGVVITIGRGEVNE